MVVARAWEEKGMGYSCLMGTVSVLLSGKSSGKGWWWHLHNINVPNFTKVVVLCCVSSATI